MPSCAVAPPISSASRRAPLEWWDDESAVQLFDVESGMIRFDDRTTLQAKPLIGCLAVAPEEGTVHAKLQGRYGGNLDTHPSVTEAKANARRSARHLVERSKLLADQRDRPARGVVSSPAGLR
jgi:hypothetical protein